MADEQTLSDRDVRGEGPRLVAAMALVTLSVVLGGASRENPLRLTLVEVASLPLLALSLGALARNRPGRALVFPLAVLGLTLAVPLLQLIPLPPTLWTRLPGHAAETLAFRLAGLAPPWATSSLAPRQTLISALALAPPIAMILGVLSLGPRERRILIYLWLALAAAGLVLGAAQLAGGATSPFYLYETTNTGSLVGFFANRNHEAAFLLALLPLAAGLIADGQGKQSLTTWLLGLFCLLAIVGLGVVGSRAGVILAAPALLACLVIVWKTGRRGAVLAGAAGLALAGVLAFNVSPIAERFDAAAPPEFRLEAWPYVAKGAAAYLPLGAGVGAFDRVFRSVEPLTLVGPTYFNHAHNDYLELWLEAGLVGAALMAAFAIWLAQATWAAWRGGGGASPGLARGAGVAIALILLHSAVDYPLRTTSVATLFAFCCGVLASRQAPKA